MPHLEIAILPINKNLNCTSSSPTDFTRKLTRHEDLPEARWSLYEFLQRFPAIMKAKSLEIDVRYIICTMTVLDDIL